MPLIVWVGVLAVAALAVAVIPARAGGTPRRRAASTVRIVVGLGSVILSVVLLRPAWITARVEWSIIPVLI